MQDEGRVSRADAHQTTSAIQLGRLRLAADNHLQREMRRTSTRLGRLLGHVAVLEALGDLQHLSSSSDPPSYDEAATKSTSTPCTGSGPAVPGPDEIPELEEAEDAGADSAEEEEGRMDDDEVVSDDDQNDVEHALVRVSSHPAMPLRRARGDEWIASAADLRHDGECIDFVSEGVEKARKAPSETAANAVVLEVAAVDD